MRVLRALLSVYDKSGVVELAQSLHESGVELISSGGTAGALRSAGIPVTGVAEVTGAPEILGGRVKTLHPKIHGGILADRDKAEHLAELDDHSIAPIDLVVCNLYPFERTVAEPNVSENDAVEQIDIGGPAMVRAAAKNFSSVAVVVSPARYRSVIDAIKTTGSVPIDLRRELAGEAFSHTATYDAAIASYFTGPGEWPKRLVLSGDKIMDLRYGENPHQEAAFYRTGAPAGVAAAHQLHGKELSYNNILDADAATGLVSEIVGCGAAIIKHSNPCGAAQADGLEVAYRKAFECDPVSAFGGIVALNRTCDRATAAAITEVFTEVVCAPDFSGEALEVLRTKKSLRVMRVEPGLPATSLRSVTGGWLVQSPDGIDPAEDARIVTTREPIPAEWSDLRFAWTVARHVKSNAIVLVKDGAAVGIGAGQMNRLESAELAARRAGERSLGSVCASDAFFPFRDAVDAIADSGARAVIQPGGSVRDDEVIGAADELGLAMVFTGRRHFRH
ncbi:MAG: bifunctional phosphoribosylaminoimidazolecarboxamide formyltransferase/IMP cyclohydrolase [Actinobacteria bacterium]|nr:bifunctional phosphoribosylaminoimidazolecarboxamide formyltransferase/IMP cyclohydrolase [Actinomycetota bacterium]